jgi:uncharacterized protein
MHPFLWSLLGGALIGASASALLFFNGRVAGISNIFGGVVIPRRGDVAWRVAFLLGLLAGGLAMYLARPSAFTFAVHRSLPIVGAAGLLVGFGTQLGSGCTSGHGVCGMSRLSPRSIVATLVFIATGALTVFIVNRVCGGSL